MRKLDLDEGVEVQPREPTASARFDLEIDGVDYTVPVEGEDPDLHRESDQPCVSKTNGRITFRNQLNGQELPFIVATVSPGGPRRASVYLGTSEEPMQDVPNWATFGQVDQHGVTLIPGCPTDLQPFVDILNNPNRYRALGCRYIVQHWCRSCNLPLVQGKSLQLGLCRTCHYIQSR